jgi:hypothetical protein
MTWRAEGRLWDAKIPRVRKLSAERCLESDGDHPKLIGGNGLEQVGSLKLGLRGLS